MQLKGAGPRGPHLSSRPARYGGIGKIAVPGGTARGPVRFIDMRSGLSFDHIFPIRNDASARLMRLKADCLLQAGVIDVEERSEVYARSSAVLGFAETVTIPASALRHTETRAAALVH